MQGHLTWKLGCVRACCLFGCVLAWSLACLLAWLLVCLFFIDSFVGLFIHFLITTFPLFCACASAVAEALFSQNSSLEKSSTFGIPKSFWIWFARDAWKLPCGQRANTTDLLTAVAGCSAVFRFGQRGRIHELCPSSESWLPRKTVRHPFCTRRVLVRESRWRWKKTMQKHRLKFNLKVLARIILGDGCWWYTV